MSVVGTTPDKARNDLGKEAEEEVVTSSAGSFCVEDDTIFQTRGYWVGVPVGVAVDGATDVGANVGVAVGGFVEGHCHQGFAVGDANGIKEGEFVVVVESGIDPEVGPLVRTRMGAGVTVIFSGVAVTGAVVVVVTGGGGGGGGTGDGVIGTGAWVARDPATMGMVT
jgi:hypothetical protein